MDYIKRFEYKELESKIFNMRVGQVIISSPEDVKYIGYIPYARIGYDKDSLEYDLIDIRVPYQLTSCIKDVQLHNVIYVGSIVTYELDIDDSGMIDRNLYVTNNCRLATSGDLEECINIAKESFVEPEDGINRFNLDPNFKKSDIEKYYIEWINNCFNKISADEVIVYDDIDNDMDDIDNDMDDIDNDMDDNGSDIKGFISIKKIGDLEYNIPLNAVRRSERGKGAYKEMVNCVIDKLRGDGVKINIRAYLGNIAIQRTWLDLGAQIKGIEHIFHGGKYGR